MAFADGARLQGAKVHVETQNIFVPAKLAADEFENVADVIGVEPPELVAN
jgi:hypothetical protein